MIKFLAPVSDNPKYESRRYRSMWLLTAITVVLFAFPPVASFLAKLFVPEVDILVVLNETAFTTLVAGIWGSYLLSDFKTKSLYQANVEVQEDVSNN